MSPHNGRQECVVVMEGAFICHCSGKTRLLVFPSAVELPARIERTWFRPKHLAEDPRGITICRHSHDPVQYAAGSNYELSILDVWQMDDNTFLTPDTISSFPG